MAILPRFSMLGHGHTVIMLHDADGGHLTFSPSVEALASQGYRAVAVDLPGYGYTPPSEPYSIKSLAQSCLALIDALQVNKVTLVGHGLGAMVALETAMRDPSHVKRLVLCAGGPPLDDVSRKVWVDTRLTALDEGLSMEQIADRIVPMQTGGKAIPEGVRLIRHAMTEVHPLIYRHALQALPGFQRDVAALSQVSAPTLLIGGAQDVCTPPDALEALAQVLPDASTITLPGIGHWPPLESPDDFDGLVMDFLNHQRNVH
ncbi:alpha/beta fold hydrolase [Diaphorobacter sp. HDW4A]|uniref:alpha/beta fold hydrolase n=1 Tax=Diaphorobacter sp. HDW4A TaxID=2714924 RepID=UPI00140BB7E4|nr:alpha/beta fold hydrolase [Diaphorobacter sp. HDW4A]QIL82641.1 alpha/beta fold hydrolase [Diaphorobacter sp. HDW4A]